MLGCTTVLEKKLDGDDTKMLHDVLKESLESSHKKSVWSLNSHFTNPLMKDEQGILGTEREVKKKS